MKAGKRAAYYLFNAGMFVFSIILFAFGLKSNKESSAIEEIHAVVIIQVVFAVILFLVSIIGFAFGPSEAQEEESASHRTALCLFGIEALMLGIQCAKLLNAVKKYGGKNDAYSTMTCVLAFAAVLFCLIGMFISEAKTAKVFGIIAVLCLIIANVIGSEPILGTSVPDVMFYVTGVLGLGYFILA